MIRAEGTVIDLEIVLFALHVIAEFKNDFLHAQSFLAQIRVAERSQRSHFGAGRQSHIINFINHYQSGQ